MIRAQPLWRHVAVAVLLTAAAAGLYLANGLPLGPSPGVAQLGHPFDCAESGSDEGLDARYLRVAQRVQAKRAVANALVCGECTFDEAANRFRQLNADDPKAIVQPAIMQLGQRYSGASQDEVNFIQVVLFVRSFAQVSSNPGFFEEFADRLEGELRVRFPLVTVHPAS